MLDNSNFNTFSLELRFGNVNVTSENDFSSGNVSVSSSRERRAHAEFEIASLNIDTVTSATLNGGLRVRQSASNGSFNLNAYAGNGQADASDFNIASTLLTPTPVEIDTAVSNATEFDIDVTSVLQSLVDGGATHFGLQAVTISQASSGTIYLLAADGSNISGAELPPLTLTIDFIPVPTPGAMAVFGVAGLAATRRRR